MLCRRGVFLRLLVFDIFRSLLKEIPTSYRIFIPLTFNFQLADHLILLVLFPCFIFFEDCGIMMRFRVFLSPQEHISTFIFSWPLCFWLILLCVSCYTVFIRWWEFGHSIGSVSPFLSMVLYADPEDPSGVICYVLNMYMWLFYISYINTIVLFSS